MDAAQAATLGFTPLLAEVFRQSATPLPSSDAEVAASRLLRLLDLAQRRAEQLSLVTPGQDLVRELSTASLRSLFLPSLMALAQARYPTKMDHQERRERLSLSSRAGRRFLHTLDQLRILAPGTRTLAAPFLNEGEGEKEGRAEDHLAQAAQKRQSKIARFQTERALRKALETFREQADAAPRYRGRHTDRPSDVLYDAFFLAPRQKGGSKAPQGEEEKGEDKDDDDNDDDDEDEDEDEDEDRDSQDGVPHSIRTYILMLLNLHAIQVVNDLESGTQELELLRSLPSAPEAGQPPRPTENEWRLDASLSSRQGPLLDPRGKPLRPFTITSGSGSAPSAGAGSVGGQRVDLSARQRLAAEVFRPSHRLPTMTVDEYLAEEMRRGNVITGGGPEQMAELTPREQRAIRAEMDGTREATEAEDEARRETLHWDEFKEQHRKGEGNTMNRG